MPVEQFKILMDALQSLGSGAQVSFICWLVKELISDFVPVFIVVPIAVAIIKWIRGYAFGYSICSSVGLNCDMPKHRQMLYSLVMKYKDEV